MIISIYWISLLSWNGNKLVNRRWVTGIRKSYRCTNMIWSVSNTNDSQMKEMQSFETIFIDQVSDKFDGLKDLFHSHPHGPFFLIKFWADVPLPMVNFIGSADQSFLLHIVSAAVCIDLFMYLHGFPLLVSRFWKKWRWLNLHSKHPLDQFVYRFDRSPLSYYLVEFIQKLRTLSDASLMNDVLEVGSVTKIDLILSDCHISEFYYAASDQIVRWCSATSSMLGVRLWSCLVQCWRPTISSLQASG